MQMLPLACCAGGKKSQKLLWLIINALALGMWNTQMFEYLAPSTKHFLYKPLSLPLSKLAVPHFSEVMRCNSPKWSWNPFRFPTVFTSMSVMYLRRLVIDRFSAGIASGNLYCETSVDHSGLFTLISYCAIVFSFALMFTDGWLA